MRVAFSAWAIYSLNAIALLQDNERLLKLYEGGLPTWAIYAPQYGMWYRPWMRRITYMLFLLVSAFSLVMGFYDLYKNFPYLDGVSKIAHKL